MKIFIKNNLFVFVICQTMNAKKKPLGIAALISEQKKQAPIANPINLEAQVNAGRNHSKNMKRKPESGKESKE
jgi:hypothetical protein